MTKIILCGCSGRMGMAISDISATIPDVKIVAGIDKYVQSAAYASINEFNGDADVIVSYLPPTETAGTLEILNYGIRRQIPVIICTTALPQEIEHAIVDASKKVAVLKSANMSLGVNLLANMLGRASKLLYESQFDIEIIEKHHNKKLDAPSGTAKVFADVICQAIDGDMHTVHDRSTTHAERGRAEIGMHSIRGGNIIGEHSIIFAGQGEVIEFKHSAISRDVFAVGTIKAAHFMKDKPIGLYSMQNLIDALQGCN